MLDELAALRAARSGAAVIDDRAVLDAPAEGGVVFTNERQLDPVLDRLLGTALQIVRADAGSIMLLSRERDTLVVVAARWRRARPAPAVSRAGGSAPAKPSSCTAVHMRSPALTILETSRRLLLCRWR